MFSSHAETAVHPDVLSERLPAAPGRWERSDEPGGIIEYRLPSDVSPCTAAKLAVRPEILSDAAVRLTRKRGCTDAGSDRFDSVDTAVRTVEQELQHVHRTVDETADTSDS